MKLRHILYPLALLVGYSYADILEEVNPFIWSLQPPQFIYQRESKNGMTSVMKWRRQIMNEAAEVGTDIRIEDEYECKMTSDITYICDFR